MLHPLLTGLAASDLVGGGRAPSRARLWPAFLNPSCTLDHPRQLTAVCLSCGTSSDSRRMERVFGEVAVRYRGLAGPPPAARPPSHSFFLPCSGRLAAGAIHGGQSQPCAA